MLYQIIKNINTMAYQEITAGKPGTKMAAYKKPSVILFYNLQYSRAFWLPLLRMGSRWYICSDTWKHS